MHTRLTTLMALAASLSLPVTAMAQEAVNTDANDSASSNHIVKTDEAKSADADKDEAKSAEDKKDDKDDDKSWSVSATLGSSTFIV